MIYKTRFSCWVSLKPNMALCGVKHGMTRFSLIESAKRKSYNRHLSPKSCVT